MLQYNTISPGTLRTLLILMSDPKLQDFVLIGGTGLALHIGHRMSIDLDLTTLFTGTQWERQDLNEYLQNKYHFKYKWGGHNVSMWTSEDANEKNTPPLKLDFHRYPDVKPMIKPAQVIDHIRLASIEDIAAMKLAAIMDIDRKEIKDFFDIATLSFRFTLNEMIAFYKIRNPNDNETLIPKKLSLMETILHGGEHIETPNKLVFDIKKLRERINAMISNPDKKFLKGTLTKRPTSKIHRQ